LTKSKLVSRDQVQSVTNKYCIN